jgi:hypothetical protein
VSSHLRRLLRRCGGGRIRRRTRRYNGEGEGGRTRNGSARPRPARGDAPAVHERHPSPGAGRRRTRACPPTAPAARPRTGGPPGCPGRPGRTGPAAGPGAPPARSRRRASSPSTVASWPTSPACDSNPWQPLDAALQRGDPAVDVHHLGGHVLRVHRLLDDVAEIADVRAHVLERVGGHAHRDVDPGRPSPGPARWRRTRPRRWRCGQRRPRCPRVVHGELHRPVRTMSRSAAIACVSTPSAVVPAASPPPRIAGHGRLVPRWRCPPPRRWSVRPGPPIRCRQPRPPAPGRQSRQHPRRPEPARPQPNPRPLPSWPLTARGRRRFREILGTRWGSCVS